jgi:glucose-6-phosphate dehydrogenase assembly protein OpcA
VNADVFDALPGLEVPVGAIGRGLAEMWSETAAQGRAAPATEDSKATQVNFVLHLGFNTTAEDAAEQFQVAVGFSRRYPSRVVVLCPLTEEQGGDELRAKVYGECTLGKSKDDTRCCEFVMLSYPFRLRIYLESEVSTCLSTDLPLYYWAHRFAHSTRLADYQYLLTRSHRILIDSATAPEGFETFAWPRPEAVRDLAYARLLPVRQSLGQFLSRYPMAELCRGLRGVALDHGPACAAEARVLLGWLRERLGRCGENRASFEASAPAGLAPRALALSFAYEGGKSFSWAGDLDRGQAMFQANFGTGRTVLPAAVGLLPPENALSEAMFF